MSVDDKDESVSIVLYTHTWRECVRDLGTRRSVRRHKRVLAEQPGDVSVAPCTGVTVRPHAASPDRPSVVPLSVVEPVTDTRHTFPANPFYSHNIRRPRFPHPKHSVSAYPLNGLLHVCHCRLLCSYLST